MGLLLNVPYAEKEEAKALGARWNSNLKKWYVSNPLTYPNFSKWIDFPKEDICFVIIDHIYVVEAPRICWKCGNTTRIMAFGIEDYYEFLNPDEYDIPYEYNTGIIHLLPDLPDTCFPQKMWDYFNESFHFHLGHSYQGGDYRANHCSHCGAIQGYFPLFCEPDSPFFIYNATDAARLTLYKFDLTTDWVLGDIGGNIGSSDDLIKQYGRMKITNIVI